MKAIVYHSYGKASDVLRLEEMEKPEPKTGEVLLKVKAIALNPRDTSVRNGDFRILSGTRFPKLTGADFSGTVEQTGSDVHRIKAGEDVFGYYQPISGGSSAEYIVVAEKLLAPKPADLSHPEAATLGCAYLTALQSLRDKAGLRENQKLLIYGASGGVGTAAVQLGKYMHAEVTAVSSSKNRDFCLRQGADHFIAYDREDVFSQAKDYDVFFQVYSGGGLLYRQARSITRKEGVFVCLIPNPLNSLRYLFSKPKFTFLAVKGEPKDLQMLAELRKNSHLRPHIERKFSLEEMAAAHELLESNHVRGKLVIQL